MKLIATAAALFGPFSDIAVQGGSYLADGCVYPFDVLGPSSIIDTPLPDGFNPANYTWNGSALVARAMDPSDLAALRGSLLISIDLDVDAIYKAAIGRRQPEYDHALIEAQAYKAAGYAGPVPASAQSWATAKNWTATQATDDILAAAARLASARDAIRLNRLTSKETARNAPDQASLATIKANWQTFVVSIRGQLGVPPAP